MPATTGADRSPRPCAARSRRGASAPLITAHGIRLWRKGLPVQPRPPAHPMPPPGGHRVRTVAERIADLVRDAAGHRRCRSGCAPGTAARPARPTARCSSSASRRALRRLLWAPGELGLARAYVTGDIDVEGDLADGLAPRLGSWPRPASGHRASARAARGCGPRWPPPGSARSDRRPRRPRREARLRGRLHTRARDRAAIAHHYDLSNDFYALLLDESMAYSCGLLHRRRTRRWPTRSAPSST